MNCMQISKLDITIKHSHDLKFIIKNVSKFGQILKIIYFYYSFKNISIYHIFYIKVR